MSRHLLYCLVFVTSVAWGQTATPSKQLVYHTQSWYALNSTFRFSERWGAVGDLHIRKDGMLDRDYFYFLRIGVVYWIQGKYPVTAGVARLWLAPPEGLSTWAIENRIYQQWSAVTEEGRVTVLHRIRTEQRWRDQVVNDEVVGSKVFSFRLRYLASFQINVFKDTTKPSLVVSDEVLVQYAPSLVYNTFDQNRFFVGIRVPLGKNLSLDTGYMNVLQQRAAGNIYDVSNVFRIFVYWNVDFSGKGKDHRLHGNDE